MRKKKVARGFLREIPHASLRGNFLILSGVVDALEASLPTYRGLDGHHEGIAFLCGVENPSSTIFTTAIFPEADHRKGYVRCSEEQFAEASAVARRLNLGLLAQVHTHPGPITLHSIGDDDMVRPRYDGMLSIVVPDYSLYGLRPFHSLGVHQFQDGEWRAATEDSVRAQFCEVSSAVDLR